jgi:OPA family sugar phosphate sensor protein UhpC-like MFS transporter
VNVWSIFSLFAAAPFLPEIQDKQEVKTQYKFWRWRIFYSLFFGYVLFYCTRKSYSYAMPVMLEDLGLSKADFGMLGSIFYLTYGFSKFGTGIISDYCNPRYFMAVGLIITGVLNLMFAASSSIVVFGLFWGFNGLFQGFGWPPITKLLTHWYHPQERGKWWSLISCSHNIGGGFIPLLVAGIAYSYNWRWAICVFPPSKNFTTASASLLHRSLPTARPSTS